LARKSFKNALRVEPKGTTLGSQNSVNWGCIFSAWYNSVCNILFYSC